MTAFPRHEVRDVPRGIVVGTVQCQAKRQWVGVCGQCGSEWSGNTRPAAARVLVAHVRRAHWVPA